MEIISIQTSQPLTEEKARPPGSQNEKNKQSDDLLFAGIVHDLANLCHIILGNIELLVQEATPHDKNYKKLQTIKSTAFKTINLCKIFMTDSCEYISDNAFFSLNELIKESSCLEVNRSTHIVYPGNDVLWNITADRREINLLLKNILYNAEQSMPAGGNILITAENISVEENSNPGKRNYVKISVKDHGCGIPENHMDKIFTPKFTTKKNGNGIGLALCKRITDKYKGSIQVDSVLEKGTVMSVFLPAINSQPYDFSDIK